MNIIHYLAVYGVLMLLLVACESSPPSAAADSTVENKQAAAQVLSNESFAHKAQEILQLEGESGMRASYQECLDKTGGVTPDIQECISEEYIYQEQRLNDVYTRLLAVLDSQKVEELRNEQQQWIAKRDSDCEPGDEPGDEPGQAQMLMANDCALEMTASRVDELEKLLKAAVKS